jgi:hypothetical protein
MQSAEYEEKFQTLLRIFTPGPGSGVASPAPQPWVSKEHIKYNADSDREISDACDLKQARWTENLPPRLEPNALIGCHHLTRIR